MRTATLLIAIIAMLALGVPSRPVAQDAPEREDRATEANDEKVSLLLKWKKGDVQRYKSTQVQDVVQEMAGSPTTETKTVQIIVSTCTDVDDDGIATVEMKYELIHHHQKSSLTTTEWRSDRPEEGAQELALMMGPLSRATYTIKYDAKGQIIEVKGFDKVIEEVVEGYDEGMRDMLRDMMQGSMSDKAMLKMMNDGNAALPSIPVGKGDTWQSETRANMGTSDMIAKFDCVLDEIEAGKGGTTATISGKGKLTMVEAPEGEDRNAMLGGFDITIEDDEVSVETSFDVDRGLTLKSVITQSFRMIMKEKGGDLTVDQTTKSTTTMEMLPATADED